MPIISNPRIPFHIRLLRILFVTSGDPRSHSPRTEKVVPSFVRTVTVFDFGDRISTYCISHLPAPSRIALALRDSRRDSSAIPVPERAGEHDSTPRHTGSGRWRRSPVFASISGCRRHSGGPAAIRHPRRARLMLDPDQLQGGDYWPSRWRLPALRQPELLDAVPEVTLGMPSACAAREMFHPDWRSVSRIRSRSCASSRFSGLARAPDRRGTCRAAGRAGRSPHRC